MFKEFLPLLGMVVVLALSLGACATTTPPGQACAKKATHEHTTFFGYYGVAGWWGEEPYLTRVTAMGNCNVVVLSAIPSRPLSEDLKYCREHGLKAIIEVQACFFDHQPTGEAYTPLVSDWEARWSHFKGTIAGYEDSVLAFYFDEPHWNGVPEADFHSVCLSVRRDYPSKRVMAILAYVVLDPERFEAPVSEISDTYLRHVTDTGFDHYEAWDKAKYPELLRRMRTKMSPEQGLWFVPWAFAMKGPGQPQLDLTENLLKMYRLALDSPSFVGMLPFTISTPAYGGWEAGIGRMFDEKDEFYDAFLKNIHVNIGKAIAHKATGDLFIGSHDYNALKQGVQGWTYEQWDGTGTQSPLPVDEMVASWSDPNGEPRFASSYMVPGPGADDTARVWTAPRAGSVFVLSNGRVRKMFPNGDGARIAVFKNSERIWPEDSEWHSVESGDMVGVSIRTMAEVVAGDRIAFLVNSGESGDHTWDALYWDPVISYDSK